MYTKVLISTDKIDEARALVLRSNRNLAKRRKTPTPGVRRQAEFGSKSYRDALQRAFNEAKTKIFFNPDMKYFVTLTYEGIEADYEKVMSDVKALVKRERRYKASIGDTTPLKYAYVMEWQKRGSLHVHMITNKIRTHTNKNGYQSVTHWRHGIITSCLTIKDFDKNFKPYLYLFKYMRKAERIGKTFVHTSRNLNNYKQSHHLINLIDWTHINQEYTFTTLQTNTGRSKKITYYRNYLKYDMMQSRQQLKQEKEKYHQWHKVLLHSTREKEKNLASRFEH